MALFSKLLQKIRGGSTSSSDWAEVEEALIASDLGAKSAEEIIALAKKSKGEEVASAIFEALNSWLSSASRKLPINNDRPSTILIVGVNGTGKTTSTAKLISHLKLKNHSVLVAAADTFRAAAVDQLATWGSRLEVEVVTGPPNGDPASVAFEAATKAKLANIDYLIVDTAGRLHTKSGLMDELGKIRRVIEKVLPVDEVLLVVDATTGQNGIVQAKMFMESVAVTGLILTKMDGSAKGGRALAIERECGIPIKFIGTGESAQDLEAFDPERY
ncbi:MAG: signal recognition particle-docking protein FtsY, partial [Actinobacteria bacterium]|nr:signal recognition particle-docking protein FtsY [Actinomycetota bacterium]